MESFRIMLSLKLPLRSSGCSKQVYLTMPIQLSTHVNSAINRLVIRAALFTVPLSKLNYPLELVR